jgi:hypothetical protein
VVQLELFLGINVIRETDPILKWIVDGGRLAMRIMCDERFTAMLAINQPAQFDDWNLNFLMAARTRADKEWQFGHHRTSAGGFVPVSRRMNSDDCPSQQT